jgi:hypothetical protein
MYFDLCRVFPGRWIGPWTGCRALEAAATSNTFSLPDNLAFKVLGGSGGGAPLLPVDECVAYFEYPDTIENKNENENGLVLLFPLVLGLGKVSSGFCFFGVFLFDSRTIDFDPLRS